MIPMPLCDKVNIILTGCYANSSDKKEGSDAIEQVRLGNKGGRV
jgi:hypothetical protein